MKKPLKSMKMVRKGMASMFDCSKFFATDYDGAHDNHPKMAFKWLRTHRKMQRKLIDYEKRSGCLRALGQRRADRDAHEEAGGGDDGRAGEQREEEELVELHREPVHEVADDAAHDAGDPVDGQLGDRPGIRTP